MLEERVVARQGKPAGRNWAPTVLGPLTVEDLESFVAEVRSLEADGFDTGEVYATVRFGTGFTNIKVTCTRKEVEA
jgi:hypothetical protein